MTAGLKSALSWLGVGFVLALGGSVLAQTTTYDLRSGEVIAVDGNNLIVRASEGVREFVVPDDFRFDLDGRLVSVHDLLPGMKLSALITTTTTPVDLQATEVRDAEVVYTNGNSIVVRNSVDGKYRKFTSAKMRELNLTIYKDGKVVPVTDIRKGDRISATIVTKLPPVEMTEQEITVLAQPAAATPLTPMKKIADLPRITPPGLRVLPPAGAPPAPTPAATPAPPAPPAEPAKPAPPKALPKTASSLPLVGLFGLLSVAAGLGLTLRRFSAVR